MSNTPCVTTFINVFPKSLSADATPQTSDRISPMVLSGRVRRGDRRRPYGIVLQRAFTIIGQSKAKFHLACDEIPPARIHQILQLIPPDKQYVQKLPYHRMEKPSSQQKFFFAQHYRAGHWHDV